MADGPGLGTLGIARPLTGPSRGTCTNVSKSRRAAKSERSTTGPSYAQEGLPLFVLEHANVTGRCGRYREIPA